jgi:hypothetical protein
MNGSLLEVTELQPLRYESALLNFLHAYTILLKFKYKPQKEILTKALAYDVLLNQHYKEHSKFMVS